MSTGALAQTSTSALMERVKQFGAALNARDATQVSSFYTPDAIVVGADGKVATGRDAIKASFDAFFMDPGASLDGSPVRSEVSGDLAYVFGNFTAAGKGTQVKGHYVEVWKRSGGEWRIAYDFVTAVPPPER